MNSWTTQAKEMRGSMPPMFEVRDILRTLEEAKLENKMPIWDDGRMIKSWKGRTWITKSNQ